MAKKLSRKQREEEKRQKRIRMIMGWFIISILVISSFAFVLVFYSPSSQTGYNFKYEIRDNALLVRTSEGLVPFYNFPDERFTLTREQQEIIRNSQLLVVAFDPTNNESAQYAEFMRFDLEQYLPVGGALLQESELYPQFPVVDCSQATNDVPIILLSNESLTTPNCVSFNAQGIDALYVRDSVLYAYFDLL